MQPPIDSAEEGAAAEDIDSLLSEVSAGLVGGLAGLAGRFGLPRARGPNRAKYG